MAYYVGDTPADDIVVEPVRGFDPIDLTQFDAVEVKLYGADGLEIESAGFIANIGDDILTLEWPTESLLEEPGLYTLRVTLLHTVTGVRERLKNQYIVVQGDEGWATLDDARDQWPDAEVVPDHVLWELLEISKHQCIEFAPVLALGQRVPTHYRKAQMMQARNILNSSRVDAASGGDGEDTFMIRSFPLDWVIKQELRPLRGIPVVG